MAAASDRRAASAASGRDGGRLLRTNGGPPAPSQQSVPVHAADDLTIMQIVNEPAFTLYPHDHALWSACAYYGGRGHDYFWWRTSDGLKRVSGKEYGAGDVLIMGANVGHSISNPLGVPS